MRTGRIALVVTCILVASLGTWFAIAQWDDANKIATTTSALGAVAAVGVAVWAAVRTMGGENSITVSKTGRASSAAGGKAITGISGTAESVSSPLRAERTGDATATGGGDAVTGIQLS